jgi:hypothetical protein
MNRETIMISSSSSSDHKPQLNSELLLVFFVESLVHHVKGVGGRLVAYQQVIKAICDQPTGQLMWTIRGTN